MSFTIFKRAFFYFFQSKRMSACLLVCFLFLFVKTVAASGAGSLDTTFGSGGKVLTPFKNLYAGYNSKILLQPDGSIVMACIVQGSAYHDFHICLARFKADGSLDTGFGASGKVIAILEGDNSFNDDFTTGLAIQPDGKIVVTGYISTWNGDYWTYKSVILRYTANGAPDTSFDGDGVKFADNAIFRDVVIQPDGKIVIAGLGIQGAIVIRLNTNGSFDTTFDGDGIAATSMEVFGYSANITAVAIQPDGKIVLSGTGDWEAFFVIRHNSDGSPDTGFDNDGMTVTQFGGTYGIGADARAMIIQPDGKIMLAGYAAPFPNGRYEIVLVRYNPNGSPDTSFDTDGKVTTHVSASDRNDEAYDAVLQPDGKILVLGSLNRIPNASPIEGLWGILRYNADGSLDSTFNGDGIATTTVTGTEDFASSMLLLPDGKLLVSGRTGNPSVFALLRFNTTAESPFDFDDDGKTDISIFRPTVGEWWYLKSSNGQNYAAQFGASTDKLVPGDFTGDGKTDIAVWRPISGEWFILRSEDGSYFSFPFGISGDVPAPADYDADGRTDAAVFRPSNATWYISKSTGGTLIQSFGLNGDAPVAADYDGDGRADIAIYRPSAGEWWIQRSTAGTIAFQFGNGADKLVQGDYTGDGKADVAVWRPVSGEWFILRSEDSSYYSFPFGLSTDIPAPGDFDGDGRFDATVFRPSQSTWYSQRTTAGTLILPFGQSGDRPVPNAFVP
jgi:uncharacterized delta-60 repeat protein